MTHRSCIATRGLAVALVGLPLLVAGPRALAAPAPVVPPSLPRAPAAKRVAYRPPRAKARPHPQPPPRKAAPTPAARRRASTLAARRDAPGAAIPDHAWRPPAELRKRRAAPHLMRAASVLLPLGGVLVMAGGIAMAVAAKDVDDISRLRPGSTFPTKRYDTAQANHIAGIVLLSTGGLALVGAAVTFGLSRAWSRRERAHLTIAPWLGTGAGVRVSGRF